MPFPFGRDRQISLFCVIFRGMKSFNTTAVIPIASGADGVLRMAGTRIPLETVIYAFHNGATAEEIVLQYPVLDLGDVYAVIGFYLKNKAALAPYLMTASKEAAATKIQVQNRFPLGTIRERLLEKKAQSPEKED